ncbi:MAG: hypothetical protein RLZZ139_2916 [Cyanobacteriota bacterium]|jgi:tetratricopeptide (TPR) repeat protein
MAMNLRSRYGLSLSAISLIVCPLLVAVVTFPEIVFGTEVRSSLVTQATGDRQVEADQFFSQGTRLYQGKQYQESLLVLEQALRIYREVKYRQGEGKALGVLGLVYSDLGKYDKAIEYQLQRLDVARELKDRRGEATALQNLGSNYNSLDKYEKAIEYYLKRLDITRELKNRQLEEQTLGSLGRAYYSLGKYDKAIESHLQSLEIAREIKDRISEGQSLGNLGNAYYALGKYDKAIEFHLQHLALSREIKNRDGEGVALGNLGIVYRNLGKYDKAIEFQLQTLAITREIKDRRGEGQSLGNLGNAYYDLGKYDKAIEFHLLSLAISREIRHLIGEGQSLGSLGGTYNALGKYDKAIEFLLQRLDIAKELRDRRGEMYGLNNLAVSYDRLNRDREVMISLQQALTIAKETGDRSLEGLALANLGNILSKAKRPELAITFYKQSINVREAIRKDIKKLDKDLQQSYLATVEKTYRDLADILLQQNRIIEALQVLDLLKVQELEDYLKNIKGSDRSAQGVRLLAPEQALSDKLLTVSPDNSQDINNQLANQIQQLPKTEINEVPDYLNQIPNGTVLLYPFILGDRLEIILFAPNNLPIRRTTKISKDQLETLINDFRTGLLDAGSEDFKEPSIQLYNLLIKPIETELAQLNTKTILYAPMDNCATFPLPHYTMANNC